MLLSKIFREYDINGNSYLGAYDLDLMLKKLSVPAAPHVIELALAKIDKNQSGYIEF